MHGTTHRPIKRHAERKIKKKKRDTLPSLVAAKIWLWPTNQKKKKKPKCVYYCTHINTHIHINIHAYTLLLDVQKGNAEGVTALHLPPLNLREHKTSHN